MRLIDVNTGIELKKGDIVTDFRDEKSVLMDWQEPQHPGSTGRVGLVARGATYKRDDPNAYNWVFPGVIDARFVE